MTKKELYDPRNYLDDIDFPVNTAVERIIEAYKFSQSLGLGKLYVAFSGGKDSVCIYYLCKMAAERLGISMDELGEYHYNVTTIDPPELVYFIRTFKNVRLDRPKRNFWELMLMEGYVPTRLARFCCKELKERGGKGRFCVTGVRWAESVNRRANRGALESLGKTKAENRILNADNDEDRRELEHCIPKRKYVCNPIVDWGDETVWRFIVQYNLPYCKLYDEGWKRLGCIGCPMASSRERERAWERYPGYKRQLMRTFKRLIENRRAKGLKSDGIWENEQILFDWWIEKKEASK